MLRSPIETIAAGAWQRIDVASKTAFYVIICLSLLAFGFEMTNLTLHHDDLVHLMVQQPLVGYYLGRFVHASLFYYGLGGQYAPVLHMALGVVLMAFYGVLVARLWGAQRALDVALIGAVVCVFPYMAQIYQYNSAMVAYPLAHLMVAGGVTFAVRSRVGPLAVAAVLFFLAFSIYQAVLANAVTILLIWLLARLVATDTPESVLRGSLARSVIAVSMALILGGIAHVVAVSSLNIPFDAAQGVDEAFSLRSRLDRGLQLGRAASDVLHATRAFLFWPETYFPLWLKWLQLVLIGGAALGCLILPRGAPTKLAALTLLVMVMVSPRVMMFMHPKGNYHSLTATAYALVIGAAAMLSMRIGMVSRTATALVAASLLAGYVAQCNWISTVNHLNTMAHFSTTTQILARVRSNADPSWDGRTVAVVGSYDMPSSFPYKPATGVASRYMDPSHMTLMARLLRDEARFVKADQSMPKVMEFAATHAPWPSPQSVGFVEGTAVVVLSRK